MVRKHLEAFLDIETTGLSPDYSEITVVGIYLTGPGYESLIQLVSPDINGDIILAALEGVKTLYTYNGRRFDLPFIRSRHGVDLEKGYGHCDLMHNCQQNNLFGGLKTVEKILGINRQTKEVDGIEAIRLWWRYVNDYDENALKTLLDYNREDVVNLKVLKDKLLSTTLPRPD